MLDRSDKNFGFINEIRKSTRHPDKRINDLDYGDDIVLLENSIRLAIEQLMAFSKIGRRGRP